MTIYLGIVSQKGGVGKSTIARLLAREYALAGWQVKIADLDISQATSANWNRRRMFQSVVPAISVETFGRTSEVFKQKGFDLIIFDGAPQSTRQTLEVANGSDLIIIPTGVSLDDLEPSLKLAYELKEKGISPQKITFVLNNVGSSIIEIEEAVNYLLKSPFVLINGTIPSKTAYRKASDYGKALSETPFESLNVRSVEVAQSVINLLSTFTR